MALALEQFPRDLIDSVARDAERDADRVAHFLGFLGYTASPERPVRLPAALLLDLGAALRLLEWEANGITVHRDAGLPPAPGLVLQIVRNARAGRRWDRRRRSRLGVAVLQLGAERLAWRGRDDLGVDVVLDVPDEDTLVEAMAQFLWRRRAAGAETTER